ncbi:dimethylhistidine N-methyltransferase [Methylobacterium gregans]|uniref:Histidine N-alpha-methyltransferase n=1 Tax=Methylobacterium gregans TaxID=374424 RepID=A0AA37MBQ0_9HYPH|nr:L-histidine N(alpha)-methyltransferase [Methylobacterium gregans]MDQ0518866.1 dimethylhistidine N-methyltransferase [Methylobacterium gregans]GJD79064.1 Histidine N-alpha-methyltransferase [Methylobacterium gregans]GLS56488.1 dimethylhistidine N-methyltransferase [Methylobacterium gregans]
MAGAHEAFAEAVRAGLAARPRTLPGTFLWDEAGSVLFDRICDSPDYHPTGRETALLPAVAEAVAGLVGPGASVVEYGSGASRKVRTLLDALDRPARYLALDISRDYLESSVARLAPDYPAVAMTAVCADYGGPVRLPVRLDDGPVLGFFPGTSIGNFPPEAAQGLLARIRDTLGPSRLLVGVDPTQDEDRLRRSYGGPLMAEFHRNILVRMRRELDVELHPDGFAHAVRIEPEPFRVEAHLVARGAQAIRLDADTFTFADGESVRTDTSHKYPPDAFRALAERAGWLPERVWLDPDGLFSLHLLRTV